MYVRPKKHLGQHFLKDTAIAQNIANLLSENTDEHQIIEIGPGTGVLSQYLFPKFKKNITLMEIDSESINYLVAHYPTYAEQIVQQDFLKADISSFSKKKIKIIGNFPYNISSQIYFKALEHKDIVDEVVGMLQLEVAQRIASKHGKKVYGILSVLIQVWYDCDLLFTVTPDRFIPPPKVQSQVLRIKRNSRRSLDVSESLLKKVVKQSFQSRRKTLRNALKPFDLPPQLTSEPLFDKRAEQLSVEDFITLSKKIELI